MIPEGLLPLMTFTIEDRNYGRTIYRLQRGYVAMQIIRNWCGCRQDVEWRDEE